MSDDPSTSATFSMPVPEAAHLALEPFVGTFRTEVKMWMGPGDPMVVGGTMVNSWVVGGLYLGQDYEGDASDGDFPNFQGKGFWGYNTVQKRYEGFWIDSASTIMQVELGQVDATGKVWEMFSESVSSATGEDMKKRTVITLIDDDHHRMEMYVTLADGQEMKSMEINYSRID